VDGKTAGGDLPAAAAAPLGTVLGHLQAQRRQVEHLPGLDSGHHRAGQIPIAPAAPAGDMPDDLVGSGDLGQIGTRSAGLLAGSAPLAFGLARTLDAAAGRAGWLGEPVGGRRLGGIRGVGAQSALQLRHPGLQELIGRLERRDLPLQRGIGRPQLTDDHRLDRDGGFKGSNSGWVGGWDRGLHADKPARPPAQGAWDSYPTRPQVVNSPTTRRQAPEQLRIDARF